MIGNIRVQATYSEVHVRKGETWIRGCRKKLTRENAVERCHRLVDEMSTDLDPPK